MTDKHFIRLAPEPDRPNLSDDEAVDVAKKAWTEAKDAQVEVVANLYATKLLARRSMVTHSYLKGVRHEAMAQVERARAVLEAVERCMDALEQAKP